MIRVQRVALNIKIATSNVWLLMPMPGTYRFLRSSRWVSPPHRRELTASMVTPARGARRVFLLRTFGKCPRHRVVPVHSASNDRAVYFSISSNVRTGQTADLNQRDRSAQQAHC